MSDERLLSDEAVLAALKAHRSVVPEAYRRTGSPVAEVTYMRAAIRAAIHSVRPAGVGPQETENDE